MHERKENNTEKIQSQNPPKRQVFHVRFVDLFKRELNWLAGLCWVTLVESGKVSVWFVWCCCVSCVYKDDGDDKKRATKRQLENNVHISIICDCCIISVAIFFNHVTVWCIVRTFPCYFFISASRTICITIFMHYLNILLQLLKLCLFYFLRDI